MMNKFKNLIPYSHKITVYIPSTDGVKTETNNEKWVTACATLLSNCFGGATSTKATGYWVSDSEGLVKEHPTLVFAFADNENFEKKIDLIIDFCYNMKKELKQEAIATEIDGKMYFI